MATIYFSGEKIIEKETNYEPVISFLDDITLLILQ